MSERKLFNHTVTGVGVSEVNGNIVFSVNEAHREFYTQMFGGIEPVAASGSVTWTFPMSNRMMVNIANNILGQITPGVSLEGLLGVRVSPVQEVKTVQPDSKKVIIRDEITVVLPSGGLSVEMKAPRLLVDYSDKSLALFVQKEYGQFLAEKLKTVGTFNMRLTDPTTGQKSPGWVFSKNNAKSIALLEEIFGRSLDFAEPSQPSQFAPKASLSALEIAPVSAIARQTECKKWYDDLDGINRAISVPEIVEHGIEMDVAGNERTIIYGPIDAVSKRRDERLGTTPDAFEQFSIKSLRGMAVIIAVPSG